MLCYNTAFLGPLCSLEALGSRMSEANKELRSLLQGLATRAPEQRKELRAQKGIFKRNLGSC